jgi:hypothetical protein
MQVSMSRQSFITAHSILSPPLDWLRRFCLLLCLLPLAAFADDGRIEIRRAESRLVGENWQVSARIDYRLGDETLEALRSGITLRFQFLVEVTRHRSFWLDESVASLTQTYEVSYLELTDRYILRDINTGEQQNYGNLYSVLGQLGRISGMNVMPLSQVEDGSRYEIAVRAVLDQRNLPGPLQVLAFWRGDFSLESDWYRWTLDD